MEAKLDEGLAKWAVLGATIGVLEFLGQESLTHAFDRAMKHPVGRYVALGGLAVTGAHLLDLLPHEADPYYLLTKGLHEYRKVQS